jgi:hypothetical protein
MRTRRSWRNQQRLWRELGGKAEPGNAQPPPAPKTDADIDAMWWLSKRTRAMLKRDAQRQR